MNNGDEIVVDLQPENGLVYNHTFQKGNTVYSLSRYFQISIDDILKLNKLQSVTSIGLGQTVTVPFDAKLIFKGENLDNIKYGIYIPVYYEVQAKDNLFRICKYFFDQSIESMMKRNDLKDFNLALGQRLLVGWLPIDSDKEVIKPKEIGSVNSHIEISDTIGLYIKNELFNPDIEEQKDKRKLVKSKGIAIWDKYSNDQNNMFALHSEAMANSIIEIYNPLLNRTAFATVVGGIPTKAYPEDVSLIISPKVAKALGALDSRFLVEVKFYQ
ncbi:MAG: LysM peptidoglycan-binding domain-containing protein [Saprospiraceae bacterium]|nr:LysM peptidoglycan-binding domain-containing protein [Saprospiraceae bacterium]